ncbi:MAG: hypothetical protein J6M53_08025 [Bacteroidaceae bacterium]|nr:hypothetical protein [Bacteroidaceae bacterium]
MSFAVFSERAEDKPLFLKKIPYMDFIASIAGVAVKWITDIEEEGESLKKDFFYHITADGGTAGEDYHEVRFVGTSEDLRLPHDVKEIWRGYYVNSFNEKILWLQSPSEGLDYIKITDEKWLVHNRRAHKTTVFLKRWMEKNGVWKRRGICGDIVLILHTVLAMYNRYSIHAAALESNGKAQVFLGQSGNGKSTLTADMTYQGMNYMGDDLCFLYKKDGLLHVGALLFKSRHFPKYTKRRKVQIDLIEKNKVKGTLNAPVDKLYYIERTKLKVSYLERTEPMAAVVNLIHACNNCRMQYDVDVWSDLIQFAADSVPFYTFHYGNRELVSRNMFENA